MSEDKIKLIAAMKVLRQTIAEVRHAQESGPGWYTNGESGLRAYVRLHLDNADTAIDSVKDILEPRAEL